MFRGVRSQPNGSVDQDAQMIFPCMVEGCSSFDDNLICRTEKNVE